MCNNNVKAIMKKIYSFLFAATALFAAVSCQKEVAPEVEAPKGEKITFTASTEVETKTALHENGKSTIWVEGDQISVFDANKEGNNRCFAIDELSEDAKTATFSYEGEFVKDQSGMADPTVVALYPYQPKAYCDFFYYDRNYITGINFPAEQTAVAGSFDSKAAFALGLGTMNKKDLGFQNLYALLKFTVRDAGVKKVTVKVNEGAYIAGDAKIQMDLNTEKIGGSEPVFESPVLSIVENGSNTITLTCEDGFDTEATYYVAVVPTTFTSISLYCDDDLVNHKDATMTLEANKIYNLKDNGSPKKERGLAFAATTATATVGKSFTAPTLSGVDNDALEGVEYVSSNTSVAVVDASGNVTVKAAGETTITAKAAESRYYLAGETSYTLTVKEPVYHNVYVCISDLGWKSINLHQFNSTGDITTWPGEALNETVNVNNKTYYKKAIEEGTTIQLTFNNGSSNSNFKIDLGDEITVNEDIYYRLSARGAIKVDPNDKATFGYAIYVFDQKSKNQAPNLYTWNDNGKWNEKFDGNFNIWPGKAFTSQCYYKPADDQQHRHYYYYEIPTDLYDATFNYIVNKKGQTADLTSKSVNGDLYVGYWYNDANNNGFWVNPTPTTPITNLN